MIVRTRRLRGALAEMQGSLSRSDPRLVARFTLFTRLTMEEDIPPFERVRGWPGRWAVLAIRRRRRAGGGNVRWPVAGMLLIPALMVMLTLLVTLGSHSAPCGGTVQAAGGVARQNHARSVTRWYGPVLVCQAAPAPASPQAPLGR